MNDAINNAIVRKRITFYGQVQGVGFRFRAKLAAKTFGCTGWIRNEYDNTVLMEIQGTESAISDVLDFIDEGNYIRIDRTDVEVITPEHGEHRFYTLY